MMSNVLDAANETADNALLNGELPPSMSQPNSPRLQPSHTTTMGGGMESTSRPRGASGFGGVSGNGPIRSGMNLGAMGFGQSTQMGGGSGMGNGGGGMFTGMQY